MNKDQLLSLTLRQLRQEASKLSVPLYSRKTKAVLVDLILKYQEKSTKKIIKRLFSITPPFTAGIYPFMVSQRFKMVTPAFVNV